MAALCADGTDAFIKLRDERKRHPRICAISFGGDTKWREAYDALYGHGAMIENPWAGFRIYMNQSQAIDLYLKSTPALELDKTDFYSTEGAVGCDVLRVGKSTGAGSFRGYMSSEACDIDSVSERTMRVVDSSTIEVIDRGWLYGDHLIDMVQTYKVSATSPALEVSIKLTGYHPEDVFCTGVQKLDSDGIGFTDGCLAASWGTNAPDSKKPDITETVGLAVAADPVNVVGNKETAHDYLLLVRPDSSGEIRYRVLADGLRVEGGSATAEQWFARVKDFFLSRK